MTIQMHSQRSVQPNYLDFVPNNTAAKICKSIVASLLINVVLGATFPVAATAAAIAGTATLIHALITPAFMKLINKNQLTFSEEMVRSGIAIGLAAYAFSTIEGSTLALDFLVTNLVFRIACQVIHPKTDTKSAYDFWYLMV